MTFKEISEMVEDIGLPFAYYQFPEGTGQQPPFICFYFPENDDFVADNINYCKIEALRLELYTDEKDFALEAEVEAALNEAGLVYSRTETPIESERMYLVSYDTEVLING